MRYPAAPLGRRPPTCAILTSLAIVSLLFPPSAHAELGWWDGFVGNGIEGTVYDLCVFDGDVIAGGVFVDSEGAPFNVARWTGSTWEPMGGAVFPTNFLSWVYEVEVYQGDLYVGGIFRYVDTPWAFDGSVARWNGSDWVALGTGVHGDDGPGGLARTAYVYDLAVHDGLLIVSGRFVGAGPTAANGLAAWNGASFQTLASPFREYYVVEGELPEIHASTIYETDLVLGGFASPPTARWVDESSWLDLGCFDPGGIKALTVWQNSLVAAFDLGAWDCDENDPILLADELAVWSATEGWKPFATPDLPDGHVLAFADFGDDLIAGGSFSDIGGAGAAHIGAWDGATWAPLGSGLDGTVQTLLVHDDALWVGGSFDTAGGVESHGIARWGDITVSVPDVGASHAVAQVRVAPNPTTGPVRFTLAAGRSGPIRIRILDAAGREVAILTDRSSIEGTRVVEWSGRDTRGATVAPGVYFALPEGDALMAAVRVVVMGEASGR